MRLLVRAAMRQFALSAGRIGLALTMLMALSATAGAQLKLEVTRGRADPVPIAVARFIGADAAAQKLAQDLVAVIEDDLRLTGLFRLLDPKTFIGQTVSPAVMPNFPAWRAIDAQALVVGEVSWGDNGQLEVSYRIWDTGAEQTLLSIRAFHDLRYWRLVAHRIADDIYERLTGELPYFSTRIVYVAESGPRKARTSRMAIMDFDGENHEYLSDGRQLVLTPRFAPSARQIAYLAYVDKEPRVYLFNFDTGDVERLDQYERMNFAPRFSPDGNSVLMSYVVPPDNSEIFSMDLRTRERRRLSRNPAIDVSPTMSPDGRRIAFTSDRGGSEQIYVMNADGSSPRRISFDRGRYSAPVWSPRGDLIAFVKTSGDFSLGVMRPDGSGERLITSAYEIDSPTWAPNGRVLIYERRDSRDGEPRLYTIDVTGYNERRMPTPGAASQPAWSPLLR